MVSRIPVSQRERCAGQSTPCCRHRSRPIETKTGPRATLVSVPHAEQATPRGASRAESRSLDPETAEWLASLRGLGKDEAIGQLHDLLLRVARSEIRRRNTGGQITGPEVDDLAHQAAADAVLLITNRIDEFRGESRFTTWAYKFVVFEVSTKLGRHFWKRHPAPSASVDWDLLPDHLGTRPADAAELQDLIAAVRAAAETCLTQRQREVFTAIVVEGVPLDALVISMGTTRTAIYKVMFDARQKLRKELIHGGYIESAETP
jgi:RNA polymerase sigma-70 factor, ECF subfamily